MASYRRNQVADLALQLQGSGRGLIGSSGIQSKIAKRLGVSRSTISRDFQAFKSYGREHGKCPVCGHAIGEGFDRLIELLKEGSEEEKFHE
jgi:aspartyl-tRNA synthetase